MKTILWVSRHDMTQPQLAQLKEVYGDICIAKLDSTVADTAEILASPADVYAVVLPLNLLAELRRNTDKEVIQSVSGRVPTGKTVLNPATGEYEQEYAYAHLYLQRILRPELETEVPIAALPLTEKLRNV